MDTSTLSEAEVNNFNLRRQAIQNTITWEFEMWRRQEQANFEIEQNDVETKIKDEYERLLSQKREKLFSNVEKEDLLSLQNKLNTLLNQLSTQQQKTEQLKVQLRQAQEITQTEYQTSLQSMKHNSDSRRQQIVKKIATQRAKQQEMQQRSQFFRDELLNAQARLNADLVVFDQQKREYLVDNDHKMNAQIEKLSGETRDIDRRLGEAQKLKTDLQAQLERAARIKVQLQMVMDDSSD